MNIHFIPLGKEGGGGGGGGYTAMMYSYKSAPLYKTDTNHDDTTHNRCLCYNTCPV